ncbi:MAG: hypothetical protein ACREMZ_16760 [Gemmatimonadales bacterium]
MATVAVVMAMCVVVSVRLDVWCRFDRAAFDQVVAELPPPSGAVYWRAVDVPAKVCGCEVTGAYAVKGGYIFYAGYGLPTFDDTGFGYFPEGPTADLENGSFEVPEFEHLEGPWYSWSASW